MRCKTHKLKFNYTCPACDEAWVYSGRTHLLEYFNAGVRGKELPPGSDVEQEAAWKNGRKYCPEGKKADEHSLRREIGKLKLDKKCLETDREDLRIELKAERQRCIECVEAVRGPSALGFQADVANSAIEQAKVAIIKCIKGE